MRLRDLRRALLTVPRRCLVKQTSHREARLLPRLVHVLMEQVEDFHIELLEEIVDAKEMLRRLRASKGFHIGRL